MIEQLVYKEDDYELVLNQLHALILDETDIICNLANASSLLYHFLKNVNWVGFYLFKENQLVLGPFQGKPACTRIPLNKGVCGKAATIQEVVYVENVHEFEGHIACDSASNSEVVLPIVINGNLFGVLDIDSFKFNNFNSQQIEFLKEFVEVLKSQLKKDLVQY